jgi:hypothetical protein
MRDFGIFIPTFLACTSPAFLGLLTSAHRAFTDWVAHQPLSGADKELMWKSMAVADLYYLQAYPALVRTYGFAILISRGLDL